ncbi:MAG: tRNA epoxyqueuosine(34) reductase QueG [Cyclobacteriaceae bacterium]
MSLDLVTAHSISDHTRLVKQRAKEEGFQHCGISRAEFLSEEAPLLEKWLKKGFHGSMSYMERHFDERLDPTKLVPGARSVISLTYNYYPSQEVKQEDGLKIARYAYGEDYHHVIKEKLKSLLEKLRSEIGAFDGRVFVDSAPVMERQWAQRSGLGWLGKNSLLLNQNMGSYFFLAELIIDLELDPDPAVTDRCGTCTAYLDACPTGAIVQAGVVDSNRCISHLTIELKDSIPDSYKGRMDNWIFGCDVCQEVCPWNRFSKPHDEPRFVPQGDWVEFTASEWKELTEEVFKKNFKKSPLMRAGYLGLKRNISAAAGLPDEP